MSRHKSIAVMPVGQHPSAVLNRLDFLHAAGERFEEVHLLYFDAQFKRQRYNFRKLVNRLAEGPNWRLLPVVKHSIGHDTLENATFDASTQAAYLW